MGPGQKILTWVGSGWVSHLRFVFEFRKFPLKMSNFSIFFPLGQKKLLRVGKYPGWPLIYWGSKVSSGRVGPGPISKTNHMLVFDETSFMIIN